MKGIREKHLSSCSKTIANFASSLMDSKLGTRIDNFSINVFRFLIMVILGVPFSWPSCGIRACHRLEPKHVDYDHFRYVREVFTHFQNFLLDECKILSHIWNLLIETKRLIGGTSLDKAAYALMHRHAP